MNFLAPAGALPAEQGHGNGGSQSGAGELVGDYRRDIPRFAGLSADQPGNPAFALNDVVISPALPARPFVAIARGGSVDDSGVARCHGRVIDMFKRQK